ncbi:MAG TPA: hypothetical protein DCE27_10895 [Xanthomarina gelatinilytica]|nr:hypothetical protein [Xanthomarina gelatinilytica]
MKKALIYLVVFSLITFGCEQSTKKDGLKESAEKPSENNKELRALDIETLQSELGIEGKEQNGQFKVTVPQNDLNVTVDGFKIIPPMGLGSWVAFAPTSEQPMLMGDIVVTEKDLKPVQQEVIKQGLTITAIHNHFVRNEPDVMYMHIGGMGSEKQLAKSVKAIFDKVTEVRGVNPSSAEKSAVENSLDTKLIDSILGYSGTMNNGVYKITIGRPDVKLKEHGAPVSTFLGYNTWASWQGTPEKAAVAGDFTMLTDEVAPVIKALVENDIEVVAVHNHMVNENPRIFFLHYWGVGSAEKLAKGLRAALDKTGVNNSK